MTNFQVSKPNKVCQVKGCDKPFLAKGFCSKHYEQMRKHGHILTRTRYTLNKFIANSNTATILLFNMQNQQIATAIIDTEDIPLVDGYKWCLERNNYVVSNSNKRIYLHRLIMNAKSGQMIDHKNGNGLDNRKANLRFCSYTQNGYNAVRKPNNRSGIKNVHWIDGDKKWDVILRVNGKKKYIGRFKDIKSAENAAQKARIKYHGEFAYEG